MTTSEEAYLALFRETARTKAKIEAMIGELCGICESLRDWQRTAADLSKMGSDAMRPEWSEDRLKGLVALRTALLAYQALVERLHLAWSALGLEEKIGFTAPPVLQGAG